MLCWKLLGQHPAAVQLLQGGSQVAAEQQPGHWRLVKTSGAVHWQRNFFSKETHASSISISASGPEE
jgi:hypothetical protein